MLSFLLGTRITVTIAMLGASLLHSLLLLLVTVDASAFDVGILQPALFVAPKRFASVLDGSANNPTSSDEVELSSTACTGRATSVSRRDALRQALLVAGSAVVSAAALGPIQPSNAACLPGDKSVDCIGFYKVPLDDRVLPYVQTPEMLKIYAPDVRWVPPVANPKSYYEAFANLEESKDRFERVVVDSIRRGKLEDAGVELLDITPTVTVAGRVIVSELSDTPRRSNDWTSSASVPSSSDSGGGDLSMKGIRAEVVLSELVVSLGQCDILLGQGINGQLGALTPAQIQILSACTEINDLFRDLFNIIPKKI